MKNNKLINSLIQIGTILLVALVVVGVTYAMGQRATASGIEGEQSAIERDGHRHNDDHDDHDDHGPGNFRAVAGFAKTLLPITLIIAVVAGVQSFGGTSKKKSAVTAEDEENGNQADELNDA